MPGTYFWHLYTLKWRYFVNVPSISMKLSQTTWNWWKYNHVKSRKQNSKSYSKFDLWDGIFFQKKRLSFTLKIVLYLGSNINFKSFINGKEGISIWDRKIKNIFRPMKNMRYIPNWSLVSSPHTVFATLNVAKFEKLYQ